MNRRTFLSSAILAASALAVDPERLLWSPGAKKVFIPSWINVRSFGALGDGMTDDTLAIQRAINQGGLIYFPPADYRITKRITVARNSTLISDGDGATLSWEPRGLTYSEVTR